MTFKKVLSAVMAGAMVMSMGMTAFATTAPSGYTNLEGEEGWEMEVGGTVQTAVIKVQVPEMVNFVVNPYKLDVAANTELGITEDKTGTQIVSPIQKITNLSAFDIKIGGTVYGWENDSESATLVKDAFTAAGSDGVVKKEASIDFCAVAGAAGTPVTSLDKDTAGALVVNLFDAKGEAGKKIEAAKEVTVNKTGGTADAFYFHFSGKAQEAPSTPWYEGDTFGARLALTFTAVANTTTGGGGGGGA